MYHGRVLLLLLRHPVGASWVGFKGPLKATHAAHPPHAERPEGVVDVHIVLPAMRKEVIEGAAAAKELGEHGMRVSMEGVVVARTSVSSTSTPS